MQKPPRPQKMTQESAEAVGLKVLLFIVEDESRLARFLRETGVDPADLRARAGETDMLAALLGHLLEDESQLLVFASGAGVAPVDVHSARAMLGGSSIWDSV